MHVHMGGSVSRVTVFVSVWTNDDDAGVLRSDIGDEYDCGQTMMTTACWTAATTVMNTTVWTDVLNGSNNGDEYDSVDRR
jgi:hypothetical protein